MTTLPPRHACSATSRPVTREKSKAEGASYRRVGSSRDERTFRARKSGAGNESRTHDLNLGKVALYQLSYSRSEGGL